MMMHSNPKTFILLVASICLYVSRSLAETQQECLEKLKHYEQAIRHITYHARSSTKIYHITSEVGTDKILNNMPVETRAAAEALMVIEKNLADTYKEWMGAAKVDYQDEQWDTIVILKWVGYLQDKQKKCESLKKGADVKSKFETPAEPRANWTQYVYWGLPNGSKLRKEIEDPAKFKHIIPTEPPHSQFKQPDAAYAAFQGKMPTFEHITCELKELKEKFEPCVRDSVYFEAAFRHMVHVAGDTVLQVKEVQALNGLPDDIRKAGNVLSIAHKKFATLNSRHKKLTGPEMDGFVVYRWVEFIEKETTDKFTKECEELCINEGMSMESVRKIVSVPMDKQLWTQSLDTAKTDAKNQVKNAEFNNALEKQENPYMLNFSERNAPLPK